MEGVDALYGDSHVLHAVSFSVAEGRVLALLGRNGAGKSSLMRCLLGLQKPTSGRVSVFGEDVWEHRARLLGLSSARWNSFGRIPEAFFREAEAVLERVGLLALAKRPVSEVAYGERRRLEIAMALAQKPRVLLLDEPLAGLSREERAGVKRLIAGIQREVTVVMIEHDMDTALDMAERITVLHYGRVIVEGTRAEVVADPRTREVYLGH